MDNEHKEGKYPTLDGEANEEIRRQALRDRCNQYSLNLASRDPHELARLAAIELRPQGEGIVFCGEQWGEEYQITWPGLLVTLKGGEETSLRAEALWLHYLQRADGYPLTGRWVNLTEIGGRTYQQAFQGYTGDKLAQTWGEDLAGLRRRCEEEGGWEVRGLGDLAYQWRVLPRVPVCLCYRRPSKSSGAWATVLFDAATGHYAAADVAAIIGSQLTARLLPEGNKAAD